MEAMDSMDCCSTAATDAQAKDCCEGPDQRNVAGERHLQSSPLIVVSAEFGGGVSDSGLSPGEWLPVGKAPPLSGGLLTRLCQLLI